MSVFNAHSAAIESRAAHLDALADHLDAARSYLALSYLERELRRLYPARNVNPLVRAKVRLVLRELRNQWQATRANLPSGHV